MNLQNGYKVIYEKVADGKATKIIIQSEIQNVAGLVASSKGVAEDDAKA